MHYFILAVFVFLCSCNKNNIIKSNSDIGFDLNCTLKKINTVTKQEPNISIYIKELNKDNYLYALNSKRYMVPASINKIITSYLFLSEFGNEYQFSTYLYKKKDNIYLKLAADPNLTSKNLRQLIKNNKKILANRIKGNFVIDDTLLEEDYYANGIKYDDLKYYYLAPVSTIILDNNYFQIELFNKIIIEDKILEKTLNTKIKNDSYIKENENTNCSLHSFIPNFENPYYKLVSCYEKDKLYKIKFANLFPKLTLERKIKTILKQENIILQGKIKFAPIPPKNIELLDIHKSNKIENIITELLHSSNNLKADILFKLLPSKDKNTGINFRDAEQQANKLLNQYFSNFQGKIVDGSGLSSYNYITTKQMVLLLEKAYKEFGVNFLNYFPYYNSNEEQFPSTLTKAHRKIKIRKSQSVFAKTGNLPAEGVASLAGYILSENQIYVMSIIINNYYRKEKDNPPGNLIIDKILQTMVENL